MIHDEVHRNQYIGTSVIWCWLQPVAMNCSAGSNIKIDHNDTAMLKQSSLLATIGNSMTHPLSYHLSIVLVVSRHGSGFLSVIKRMHQKWVILPYSSYSDVNACDRFGLHFKVWPVLRLAKY